MSSRTTLRPNIVINAGNMSGNLTSVPTILQSISRPNYSYSWSGTSPVGSISVQTSNDYSVNPNGTVDNPGTWNTLPFTVNGSLVSSLPVTGNTGTGIADIVIGSYAIRTVYTAVSGTGSLTAIITGKVS